MPPLLAKALDLARFAWSRVHMWAAPNLRVFFHTRQPVAWLLAAVIGVGVSLAAIAFRLAIGAFQWPWLGDTSEFVATAAQAVPWYAVLLAPAVNIHALWTHRLGADGLAAWAARGALRYDLGHRQEAGADWVLAYRLSPRELQAYLGRYRREIQEQVIAALEAASAPRPGQPR